MPTPTTLSLFVVAALTLLVVPGPSVLYVVARGVHQGRAAALLSTLGVGTGALVHVAAAAIGLSALVASSATALALVKYLGATYLIYLGVRTLLSRDEGQRSAALPPRPFGRIFAQGAVIEALNPKTALFFLAFLPQFVDPERGGVAAQTLLLGILFVVLGICTDSAYALAAGTVGSLIRRRQGVMRAQRYLAGSIYIGLGVTTALAGTDRE